MSIASEITRLQGVKTNILQAISDKGVEVPVGSALGDCPALIASISGGGGGGGVPYLKNIMPTTGVKVVDESGYIGGDFFGVYYPSTNYYNNFAVVIPGADYSASGLGTVTFIDTTTTIGGRVYRTVTIGGATWLAENLDFKFSGLAVGSSGTSSSEPRANYYSNNESTYGEYGNKYGLLYNWIAVKYLEDNKNTLIGENTKWRVPTTADWDALANAVGGYSVAGTRLKSTTGWNSGNGDGTFDFNAFPAGYYYGSFSDVGSYAHFWTATESNSGTAYYRSFNTGASMLSENNDKYIQFSVRLVKDSA